MHHVLVELMHFWKLNRPKSNIANTFKFMTYSNVYHIRQSLKQHVAAHGGQTPTYMSYCNELTSQFRLRQHRRIVHDGIVLPCDVRGCLFTGSAKECTPVHYLNTRKKCINHQLVHVELVMPPSPLLH